MINYRLSDGLYLFKFEYFLFFKLSSRIIAYLNIKHKKLFAHISKKSRLKKIINRFISYINSQSMKNLLSIIHDNIKTYFFQLIFHPS